MTATKTLTPPEIGELVGLHAASRWNDDLQPVFDRIAELHAAGFRYSVIAEAIDIPTTTAIKMARHANRSRA